MTVSLNCKHCDELLTADDEDALVELVQTHARTHDHAHMRVLTPKHILRRLHRRQRDAFDETRIGYPTEHGDSSS